MKKIDIERMSIQGLKIRKSDLEFEIVTLERAYNNFPSTSILGKFYLKGALKKYKKDLEDVKIEIERRKYEK